ncbi:MAG: hypothetical protein ABGX07_16050 [Pirellulaceae bacterium]
MNGPYQNDGLKRASLRLLQTDLNLRLSEQLERTADSVPIVVAIMMKLDHHLAGIMRSRQNID